VKPSRLALLFGCGALLAAVLLGRAVPPLRAQPRPGGPAFKPRLLGPGTWFARPRGPAVKPGLAVHAPAPAPAPAAAPAPRVAVLSTIPGSGRTSLIFQPIDGKEAAAPAATFSHLEDTSVLGTVVAGTANVLVIAGTERRKDPAFGSSLLVVSEGQEAKLVSSQVYHGTRPLVLEDGRAFVQRGTEGDDPTEADMAAGHLRVDHFTIEQIDLGGGSSKVLDKYDGYIAFIAGALRHEIFVYRVGPDGADIIGLDADSGKGRTIQRPLPPFARDFSVDAQNEALLFTNADPDNPGQWLAQKLSISPPPAAAPVVPTVSRVRVAGRIDRIESARRPGLVPTAWIGRGIALNRGLGLQVLGRQGDEGKVPFSKGVDVVREFFNADENTVALFTHHEPGQKFAKAYFAHTGTMETHQIATPDQTRVDIAGVLQEGNVSKAQIREIPASPPRPIRINPSLLRRYIPPALLEDPADRERRPR
jgi:hypothetical protein